MNQKDSIGLGVAHLNAPGHPLNSSREDALRGIAPVPNAAPSPNWKELPLPDVNSRWDGITMGWKYGPGISRFCEMQRTCRVMAVAEGYVMARFKNAVPFVMHLNEWHQKYKPKP